MIEILERCIELDGAACDMYLKLARVSPDPVLSRTFERMSAEERGHVRWWTELRDEYAEGRLPELADKDEMLESIEQAATEVAPILETDLSTLSADDMLELAIRMEFFMLDPAFGELIDMLDPGSANNHREAYSRHVMRLVAEIERRHTDRGLAPFLARVLTRTYRDQERLATLATHDPLTKLLNRRGLYGSLVQWCALARRYQHELGVLVIDVDHFKTINDTYGHPIGDEVLSAIANALAQAVRGSDLVARYGGDEFAVLAPHTSAETVRSLGQRILAEVSDLHYCVGDQELEVSVSVGSSFAPIGAEPTPEQLLSLADQSLYEAKAAGRRRAGTTLEVV
jgi:diguanylate cyclase (GGDEF)-like protein